MKVNSLDQDRVEDDKHTLPKTPSVPPNPSLPFDEKCLNPKIAEFMNVELGESVKVTIPLDAQLHGEELMKANVAQRYLSVNAHGMKVRLENSDERSNKVDSEKDDVIGGKNILWTESPHGLSLGIQFENAEHGHTSKFSAGDAAQF